MPDSWKNAGITMGNIKVISEYIRLADIDGFIINKDDKPLESMA